MRRLLLALPLLLCLPATTYAQSGCTGQFPAYTLCGNNTAGQALPRLITNPTIQGPVTIAPITGTVNQGLVINQSGPNSGNTTGPQSYNFLSVTDNNNTLTGGSTLDAFGLLSVNSAASRVNYIVASNGSTPRNAGIFAVKYTGTGGTAQPVGLLASVYSNSSAASQWGLIGYTALDTAGSVGSLFPVTSEVSALAGSTVTNRTGFITFSEGPVQGSTLDAAYVVAAQAFSGHGTPGGFKNVISVSNNIGGSTALDAGANLISADSATTIANGLKLDNFTITGNLISSPKTTISGSTGTSSFGGGTLGLLSINTSTNVASGFDYFQAATSAADNQVALLAAEAANGGTFFGQLINNWSMLRAAGANNQGLVIGTAGALPLVLGTNNAARVSINGAGNVMVGAQLTPASGTTLTINQNTGGTPATSSLSNVLGQFIAADSAIGLNLIDTFGAQGFYGARYAGGTQASKSAAGGSTTTFSFAGQAWDGSVYATGAALDFQTSASTWSGSNHGMTFRLRLVADGATALTEAWHTYSTGGFSMAPSGTPIADPGNGNIAATKFFSGTSAGVTCSGPLTVISSITIKGGIITAASGTGGTCS